MLVGLMERIVTCFIILQPLKGAVRGDSWFIIAISLNVLTATTIASLENASWQRMCVPFLAI